MEILFAGHPLYEFGAKLQSYPEIRPSKPDTEVFQGSGRSSIQLLMNRRSYKQMHCVIDFLELSGYERTRRQSDFEALFVGDDPVEIDFGDGFFYRAVLTGVSDAKTVGEYITTVEYQFIVTRHTQIQELIIEPNGGAFRCESNVRKTDCTIYLPHTLWSGGTLVLIELNKPQQEWVLQENFDGDILLDGVNKRFLKQTASGTWKNIASKLSWTDFPYLIPGENSLNISINGGPSLTGHTAKITYTPTYL